jgi:DNA-binding response OmpR family regulator
MSEALDRIEAILQSVQMELQLLRNELSAFGKTSGLQIDESNRSASVGSSQVFLRPPELAIVQLLISSDETVGVEALLEQLNPAPHRPQISTLNVHLHHLRKKLITISGGVDLIERVPGRGYRIKQGWKPAPQTIRAT